MEHFYILDAVRSPRGRARATGALAGTPAADLLLTSLDALRSRSKVDAGEIADVIIGCVTQTGEQGQNVAKRALVASGWGREVPAATVNRFCASGLSAVLLAGGQAAVADGLAIGGGVESISRLSTANGAAEAMTDEERLRSVDVAVGVAADLLATLHGYSREQCDEYAALSQARAAAALESGRFSGSLVPVNDAEGRPLLTCDETVRAGTTAATLSTLTPSFRDVDPVSQRLIESRFPDLGPLVHVHHPGNSPTLADGSAAVLVGTESAARRAGIEPRARIVGQAEFCAEPLLAQTGAVGAIRLALRRAGLSLPEVDFFEVRDSFAAVNLWYMDQLGIGLDRFNPNGSSIALGHALGATGAMLISTALDELERTSGRHAVVAIAGAGGMASCCVLERLP